MAKRIPRKARNRVSYKELTERIGQLGEQNEKLRSWLNRIHTELESNRVAFLVIKNILGPDITNLSEKELRILQILHKQNILKVEIKPVMRFNINEDNIWVPT